MAKILVVGGNADFRAAAQAAITSAGHEVELQPMALAALRRIPELHPAAALVSWEVTDMNPADAVRAIRTKHRRLPIIVTHTPLDEHEAARAIQAGATACVPGTELKARLGATLDEALRAAADVPDAGVHASDEERNLKQLLGDLTARDHFARLEIEPGYDPARARRAFLAAAKLWHPSRHALSNPAVRGLASEIFMLLRESHDYLIDPAKGRAYADKILGARPRAAAPTPAQPAPPAPPPATQAATPATNAPPQKDNDLEMGSRLLRMGNFGLAAKRFEAVVARSPSDQQARLLYHYCVARDAFAAAQLDQAAESCRAALALFPSHAETLELMALVDAARAKASDSDKDKDKEKRGLFSRILKRDQ